MHKPIVTTLFLLSLAAPCSAQTWAPVQTMAESRQQHTATCLESGQVLVLGYGRRAELFDPLTQLWTPSAATPKRYGHSATLLANGQVLIAGGTTGYRSGHGKVNTQACVLYDPDLDRLMPTGSLNSMRTQHQAVRLNDGRVLVVGGGDYGNRATRVCEIYDPAQGTWTQTGSLGDARRQFTLTLLANGDVLAVGGVSRWGSRLASAEVYAPVSGSWTPAASLPRPRSAHAAVSLRSGEVLIAGGMDRAFLATCWRYQPGSRRWIPAGSLTEARCWPSNNDSPLVPLADDFYLAVGGQNHTGLLDTAETFCLTANGWNRAGTLRTTRVEHTTTPLPSGEVLVTGGLSTKPDAELFTPRRPTPPTRPAITGPRRWRD